MRRIPVGSETDPSARENGNGGQGKVCARFPSPPNPKRGLACVDVARTARSGPVATVGAVAADEPVETFLDCADRIHCADQNPDLNHRAGLPVVRWGVESGRDDHSLGVFVEDEAIQRLPPSNIACSRANTQIRDAMRAAQNRTEARRCRSFRFIVESPGYRGAGGKYYGRRGESIADHKKIAGKG